MSLANDIVTELTSEANLLGVYRKSWRYSAGRFDHVARTLCFLVLFSAAASLWAFPTDRFDFAVRSTTDWANIGFTYAITILGFLVAGFTIFSTMTRIEIFIALAKVRHGLGVSQLKFIFYSFLRVFISHIGLLFLCVITIMLKDGSQIILGNVMNLHDIVTVKKIGVSILMPAVGASLLSALLHLKAFIWNLFQSIVVAIGGAADLYERNLMAKE